MKRFIFAIFIALAMCSVASAVPVYYTASGSFTYGANTYDVTGNMMVDSQLRFWSTGEPVPAGSAPSSDQYFYNIYSYFFQIGEYAAYGVDGEIYWGYLPSPIHTNHISAPEIYFDNTQGNGPWVDFRAYFTFNDAYGNQLPGDWSSYSSLPPVIMASSFLGYGPNPWDYAGGGSVTFTQTPAPAPIPEPATMILFGTGLLGVTFLKRKKRNTFRVKGL